MEVFSRTEDAATLRFYGTDGALVGTRELDGLQGFIGEVEKGYRTRAPDLVSLGQRLYEWLDGPTERWLDGALPGPGGLAVHVDVAERLRHFPWELLLRDGSFLCDDVNRPFTPVRRVSRDAREVAPANRPLRVLLMACSPEGEEPVLDHEGEERMILEATRHRPIELVVEESGSLRGLREQVEWQEPGYFDVFHLTGHATVREGKPLFVMEDELGFAHHASADEIAEAFSGSWPRLVFLSGCQTGQAPDQGALPSMAEALVAAGAPAVLGWALPVGDVAASASAATLYEHLSVGKRVDEAVARARRELLEAKSPYWHLLRLYVDATPLEPLVTPPGARGRQRLPVREAATEFIDAGKVEVCSRERFVGRRRPIQRCLRVLESYEGEEGYAEGVLLHGMGGLWKSSMAARLCERMPGHGRVVLVGRLDEPALVGALGNKLDSPEAIELLGRPGTTLAVRLRLLLRGPLSATPFLFVLDDFDQSLEESGGGHVLRKEARDVLAALLAEIRGAGSGSRVIVTARYTFPVPGPGGLYLEGLESMRGAELGKKTGRLDALARAEKSDPALAEQVTAAGAGNPHLLDLLSSALADPGSGAGEAEGVAAEFREKLQLGRLLAAQEPGLRRLVALLAVFDLPVAPGAVGAAAGAGLVAAQLDRAVSLTLVERGHHPGGEPRYYVSPLVRPLVEAELTVEERKEARARGAAHLHEQWSGGALDGTEEELLEVHRLAMLSESREIAAAVADRVAAHWLAGSRFRDAETLSRETLRVGDDHRVLQNLARAEHVLGRTAAARGHFEAA
ncbi:MAG TPA: CHAT domain-containing protein, partial [Longimicrobiaceae bacterium]